MSYKGKYRPKNRQKYKGDVGEVVYRSLWELKFMKYCDTNNKILKWSSEEIIIPYKSPVDNRVHRYFPDFYVKYKDIKGKIREKVVEIKPAKQVKEPKMQKRRTKNMSLRFTPMPLIRQNGRQQRIFVKIEGGSFKY